jgi:hypothetical protein
MRVDRKLAGGAGLLLTGAAVAAWLLLAPRPLAPTDAVPVMIGGDTTLDACGAVAMPGGDAVEVRAGPGDAHGIVDIVGAGRAMHVCGYSDDLTWAAVVYAPEANVELDCGVTTPVAERAAYAGACRSGWVLAASLIVLAG